MGYQDTNNHYIFPTYYNQNTIPKYNPFFQKIVVHLFVSPPFNYDFLILKQKLQHSDKFLGLGGFEAVRKI